MSEVTEDFQTHHKNLQFLKRAYEKDEERFLAEPVVKGQGVMISN